jgi:hypothetical protein
LLYNYCAVREIFVALFLPRITRICANLLGIRVHSRCSRRNNWVAARGRAMPMPNEKAVGIAHGQKRRLWVSQFFQNPCAGLVCAICVYLP